MLQPFVGAMNQTTASRVRKAWECPLTKPVKFGLESLDFSCLCPGKVHEAASCSNTLHPPSCLFVVFGIHGKGKGPLDFGS